MASSNHCTGNVYPVVERTDKPNSLLRSPCQKGYNSHYVLVKNDDPTSLNYQPCNPETDVAEYDEVVVFNKDQVLPRYLVYYTRAASDEQSENSYKSCVLWVDWNDNSKLIAELQSKGVKVLTFPNSSSLRHWLTLNTAAARDSNIQIRIISNRNRAGDGDETAGIRLLQWLHHVGSEWKNVPFLVFCGDKKLVKDMPLGENCFLTDSEAAVKKFALKGRL